MQKCSNCHKVFPSTLDFFNRHKRHKGGLNQHCKSCTRAYSRRWRKEHPEYHREYKTRHPEQAQRYAASIKGRRAAIRMYIWYVKCQGQCTLCPERRPEVLVFHHRDASTKRFALGEVSCRSLKAVRKEIDKCDLLCSNCHLSLHYRQLNEAKNA